MMVPTPNEQPKIESVAALSSLLADVDDQLYIYRGQTRADWDLVPVVHRPDVRPPGIEPVWFEQHLLNEFMRQALPHLAHLPSAGNHWEWLAVAQHHCLPTRLLDWTRNAIAALFFAVVDEHSEVDAAVWCYKHGSFEASQEVDPFEIDTIHLYDPPHISSRITAQRGCFTAHPITAPDEWPGHLVKAVIPSASRKKIRRHIRTLGVDWASLFPEADAVARELRARYCGTAG